MRYDSRRGPIEFLLSDGRSRTVSSRRYVFVGGADWGEKITAYRWTDGDTYSADVMDPELDAKVSALERIGKPTNVDPRYVTF